VLYRLRDTGYFAYLVGGGVRDLLLGREPKDFDIATDARPGEIKKLFRNCRLIGRRFRLAHIHFHDEIIEVATFRSLATEEPAEQVLLPEPVAVTPPAAEPQNGGQAPDATVRPRPPRMLKTEDGMILRDNVFGTPEEDALRRDFTVNALIYNIADYSVIDYVGGVEDLRKGLLRTIGDPLVRFVEDPVRMVRAVRFAAMLGFAIEERTYQAMIELKDRLALASSARLYEEVLKLFLLGEGERTFQLLRTSGLFGVLFPGLNAWIDTEAGGFPRTRVGKGFEWVDGCVQARRQASPSFLFALLFGQYIEDKAAEFRANGVHPLPALEQAVAAALGEQAQRVLIPKKIGLAIRDILWGQQRFDKREGKKPLYFLRRPEFDEAFDYLRFTAEVTGEKRELVAWWQEFIKAHPPGPAGEQDEIKGGTHPAGPPRKRRRRRRAKPKPQNISPA
jgi:poly(A) polymerase